MGSSPAPPENMLPIMIVLGVMFIGICIAMNLFSRARFKKRNNALAAARSVSSSSTRRSARQPGSSVRYKEQSLPVSVADTQKATLSNPDVPLVQANSLNRKPSSRTSSVRV